MVCEPVDERDGAGRVGEDGVPLLEGQIRGDDDRFLLVAAAHELKEEVGGVRIVGQVADLIEGEERRARVGAEPAFEGARGVLSI